MTFNLDKIQGRDQAVTATVPERPLMDLKPVLIATALLCAFFIGLRSYEQYFSQTAGIDAFSTEFQLYWVSFLYIATTAELLAFLLLIAYLWKTRDPDVANVEPREELRRLFYLLGWIFVYGLAFYWGASYFNEQDVSWQQVAYRHSAFLHQNLIKVFVAIPLYITIGVGAFMYGRTRLPIFACKGVSVAFVCLFFGPLMLLPAAGFVEWGNTVWVLEEYFVAPVNWSFTFFGWFSLGIFGVSLQIIDRIRELSAGYEDLFVLRSEK